jgi:leucyl-tRNA synthetase
MAKYDPLKIEKKWQKYWQDNQTFVAKDDSKKPKKYVLIEFPYPSGEGLHMGHLRPYVAGDVYSRYMRLKGFETMYPMGWDAFGLPAENYAIKNKVHPTVSTAKNIANAKRQVNSWGISFDWSREVTTTDPDYYKWTQWIFLQFFKAGLAYEATGLINWCPKDKTGLANEEVIDGKCERCGTPVEKKTLRQWYLKITAYADKLLEGLKTLDWPEQVKVQQANWIGKSIGAEIDFVVPWENDQEYRVKVFTTRPDTIFGATYLVVAPEHDLIEKLKDQIQNYSEVELYINQAKQKQEIERAAVTKEKTGVELKGVYAINPATAEPIPVWVADYVLGHYGTGAIMAVPAHDERDFEFAKKFNLPIKKVIDAPDHNADSAYIAAGQVVNSGKFSDMKSEEAIPLMAKEYGKSTVQYKLRDWVFSRQRYWGEPIPLIHCSECGIVAVPEDQLPVELPQVEHYEPTGTGESPLAGIDDWVNVACPQCGKPGKRETNTMPQWAGSCWYFLRYTNPRNNQTVADQKLLKHWLPVDVYFGGMEHTTLHLLYSRFWHQFLYDQSVVPVSEPYARRIPHGIILGPDGEKMSKSRGNVINPDDVVKEFGADSMRMYELFLGPHEGTVSWNDKGIVGVRRFLDRVWDWANKLRVAGYELGVRDSELVTRRLHKLIKKVGEDIENYRFNTAVSAFMEFHNTIKDEPISKESIKTFLILLYPLAPHIAEELHELLGGKDSLQQAPWPTYDPKSVIDDMVQVIVQVNGKVKDKLLVAYDSGEAELKALALALDKVKAAVAGSEPKRVIFVPNKLINIVM